MVRSSGEPTSSASPPNDDSIVRLVGALLLEQNDEWAVQRACYMTLESVGQLSDDPFTACPPWRADQPGHAGQHGQLHLSVGHRLQARPAGGGCSLSRSG